VSASVKGERGAVATDAILKYGQNRYSLRKLLRTAAYQPHQGARVVKALLDYEPKLAVTYDVYRTAAVLNESNGASVVRELLRHERTWDVTEEMVISAAQSRQGGPELISVLLDHASHMPVTGKTLIAALRNVEDGAAILEALLARREGIRVSDNVILEAVKDFPWIKDRPLRLKLLLDYDKQVRITEKILIAAAEAFHGADDLLDVLLRDDKNLEISAALPPKLEKLLWETRRKKRGPVL